MDKIRVFEAFAGYGSQALALKRLAKEYPDFAFKVVGFSEIDPVAVKAYRALHGKRVRNYGDISEINWRKVPDFDLFTYSFPCQDISGAGLQRGFNEGSGSRSSLLWECRKAIEAKQPRYLLMENVKALLQDKFAHNFEGWRQWLESLGYSNYWQVMNSKHYGVPQNRERVFMVSIKNPEREFTFPETMPLDRRWRDILEKPRAITDHSVYIDTDAGATMQAADQKRLRKFRPERLRLWQVGNFINNSDYSKFLNPQRGRVYSCNGLAPTLCTVDRDLQACVLTPEGKVRRHTPRECFRLMDVDDLSIKKILALPVPQRFFYKLAGNSIVVAVLYHLFRQMFIAPEQQ